MNIVYNLYISSIYIYIFLKLINTVILQLNNNMPNRITGIDDCDDSFDLEKCFYSPIYILKNQKIQTSTLWSCQIITVIS